jgi:hypothetical protein
VTSRATNRVPPCPVCGDTQWRRETWFDEDEYPAVVCGTCGNGWYGGVDNDEYPRPDADPWWKTLAQARSDWANRPGRSEGAP